MRYYFTPISLAVITKSVNNKHHRGCGEKGTLLHCWWDCRLIEPLWRTVERFLKTLGMNLPYDPAIPLLGIYPNKTILPKGTCTAIFIAALLTIARAWGQPICPSTEKWIKKMWYRYTMEHYSAIEKQWDWIICRDVDRPRDCNSEWNKSEREKQISYINA